MSVKTPVFGQPILIKDDNDLAKALAEGKDTLKISEEEIPEKQETFKEEVPEEEGAELAEDFVDRVKALFPQFQLKSISSVRVMEAKELATYLQTLKEYKEKMQRAALQYKAQKEAKEEQLRTLMAEIKEKLGVDSVEELEKLKEETVTQLTTAYEGLKDFVKE